MKHFLYVLKISKNIFFLKERPVNILWDLVKDPLLRLLSFLGSVVKTDLCPYIVRYSPGVLKKTKVLDIFNADKKCIMKINIESNPQEIWLRIHFLEEKKRIPFTAFNSVGINVKLSLIYFRLLVLN